MKHEDKLGTLEEAIEFDKKRNYQYTTPQTKPLNDEEIYDLWCDADNTEYLPEMRMKNGSINYVLTTFVQLIEERHGIK